MDIIKKQSTGDSTPDCYTLNSMNANPVYHVNVNAKVEYLGNQSLPASQRYVFSYTITLHNRGTVAAKLLTRHWLITDADGRTEEVSGAGVVGEHPYLQPGESYTYTSGSLLKTPVGAMQGFYTMLADDSTEFKANIKPFTLAIPGSLH